jgi:uncharacterized protein with NRDE domain
MCLVALALGVHPRFPLVIAANRDEYFARPTLPLDWWSPSRGGPKILSGRDLEAGGTWMGISANGRLALLTNIRAPSQHHPDALSRGRIVTEWLAGADDADRFWAAAAARRHNGFNLIAADLSKDDWFWAANRGIEPIRLSTGIHGLSNAELDTPWPKVVHLKQRLAVALSRSTDCEGLAVALFEALADRTIVADFALTDTGMPLEVERQLSSAFVDMPARGYGTRCSTLLIRERIEGGVRTHVLERSFDRDRTATPHTRKTVIDDWPPSPHRLRNDDPALSAPVVDAELSAALR